MTAEVVAQALLSGLLMGCVYALIAAGLSLIFGLMEIVNFAHGEFLMLAMFATFWAWALAGLDPAPRLAPGDAPPLRRGLGRLPGVISRILGAPMLAQVFATFGLAVFLRSGAQFLWTPDFRLVQNPWIRGRLSIFGLFVGAPQLAAALAALVAFGLLYWFITRTETGLALQATAQDRQAAAAHGHQHRADVRARLGPRGGVRRGGGRRSSRTSSTCFPTSGAVFALLAYVTVALGGFGNVAATLLAGVADRHGGEPRRALGARVQVRRRLLLLSRRGALAPAGPLRTVLTPMGGSAAPRARERGSASCWSRFPWVFVKPYPRDVMIRIFLYALLAQAWNLLGGYCGQVSLGSAVFFGIGAYASSVLSLWWGVSPWLGMLAGMAAGRPRLAGHRLPVLPAPRPLLRDRDDRHRRRSSRPSPSTGTRSAGRGGSGSRSSRRPW